MGYDGKTRYFLRFLRNCRHLKNSDHEGDSGIKYAARYDYLIICYENTNIQNFGFLAGAGYLAHLY